MVEKHDLEIDREEWGEVFYRVKVIEDVLVDIPESKDFFHQLGVDEVEKMASSWLGIDDGDYSMVHFEKNIKELQELVTYVESKGWQPILVTPPILNVFKEALGEEYFELYVWNNLEKAGFSWEEIPYFEFERDNFLGENFDLYYDSHHMNKRGAAVFSYMLLQRLIENGILGKEVDGYVYNEEEKI
jgi:hypothetical protein